LLYLNNIPGSNVGVVVEHRPRRPIPRRLSLSWDVPGRGKVSLLLDEWENVTLSYELAVLPPPHTPLGAAVDAAVAWLQQGDDMRLYDDTDPGVFYLVAYTGGQDLEDVLHRAKRVTVKFDARPQRFLLSGENVLTFTAPGSIVNPTIYPAKPFLTLHGSGAGTVTLGSATLSAENVDGLTLDCETHRTGGNSGAVSGAWPTLSAGATALSFSGGVTAVEIMPRWYAI